MFAMSLKAYPIAVIQKTPVVPLPLIGTALEEKRGVRVTY